MESLFWTQRDREGDDAKWAMNGTEKQLCGFIPYTIF